MTGPLNGYLVLTTTANPSISALNGVAGFRNSDGSINVSGELI